MAEKMATAVVDLLAMGAFDDLPRSQYLPNFLNLA
jgi:hypothetical protein